MSDRSSSRRRLVVVAVLLAIAVGAVLAWRLRAPSVVVASVVTGTALDTVYAVGSVEPRERAVVRARIGGVFSDVEARRGDPVRAGAMIARIDAPTLASEVDRGQVELGLAESRSEQASEVSALSARIDALEARLELAETELGRAQQLDARGLGSGADVDRARAEVERLDSEIDALRAERRDARVRLASEVDRQTSAVALARTRLSEGQVLAPIDGTVLERLAEPGEVVQPNQSLFRIGNLATLHIEAEVDETDVARVQVGTPAQVRMAAWPRVLDAVVTEVSPDADRDRNTYLVELEPTLGEGSGDAPLLRSGMTAEVNLVLERVDGAVLVPAAAVDEGAVWRLDGEQVSRRTVDVDLCDLSHCRVLDGLQPGDQVVVDGLDGLRDGRRVRVQAP